MKRLVLVVIVLLVAAATLLLCRCSCGGKKPVCGTDKDATKVAHQLKFKRTASGELQSDVAGGCTPPRPPPHGDFVSALPGPLYTNTVQTIASSDGFFSLACGGNSLA